MWTMQQLEPNSIVYNLHLALRIAGKIDQERLKQAFRYLTARHTILRTLYRVGDNNEIIQQVLPTSELPDSFTTFDASAWPESQLQDDMARRAREPFDLEIGPLLRITCYAHGKPGLQNYPLSSRAGTDQSLPAETCHTLLICAHHIAVDLWSVLILISELKTIYAELSAGLEPLLNNLNSSYTDFVAWQRHYLKSAACDKAWNYWHRQLTGELPLLSLPTDSPRPTVSDYRGASVAFRLSLEETERLKKLAGQRGVTLFALLLTAYKVLLHRYTHQKDVIVGVPTSGRSQSRFAPIVGNFVNPLPLRSYPSGNKVFSDYLAEVNDALLTALEYQDFPFSLLVERLQPERIADHWPIYQTLFVLQQAQTGFDTGLAQLALGEDGAPLLWNDQTMQPLSLCQRIERFDLKLMAAECGDGLLLSFQYRSDLFTAETVSRIAAHFHNLLDSVIAAPEVRIASLPMIGDKERKKLLYEWNASGQPFSEDSCMYQLFEAQAARTPNVEAVVCNGERLTYGELNVAARVWAHHLITRGVSPGARIGICVERSVNFIIGILAVLKTGAAYVPIDADFPAERVAHMLGDAGVDVLLTQSGLYKTAKLPVSTRLNMDEAQEPAIAPIVDKRPRAMPDHCAYVIYTSGSTGQSKGVAISHRSLVNYTQAIAGQIQAEAGLQYALMSTPAADLGNTVLFASLVSGGCLHILDHDTTTDGRLVASYIERNPIDVMKIVPSHFAALLDSAEGKNIAPRRTLIFGGDVLQNALIARVASIRPECRVFNHYGPTEATIGALIYPVAMKTHGNTSDASAPIGRPIANSQTYILDENLEPVPVGVPGELYIGGIGVAQGYLNRSDLTAERFIPDPFTGLETGEGVKPAAATLKPQALSGKRLYRTGDLARYRSDGLVEFLGRADHQLKIRGFRIEPGEIEAYLCAHPDVSGATVSAWEDSPGIKRLAAYIVPVGVEPDQEALRIYVRNALPDYMVPSAFIFLKKLPLTPNGKLDRKALPKPDPGSCMAHQYVAPRNDAETALVTIWAEVLRVERIGIHDNFFSLGGDSILSIQMASRARQAGLNLSPRQIFQHQTVAELAPFMEKTAKIPDELIDGRVIPGQSEIAVAEFPLASLTLEEIEQIRQAVPDVEDIYPATPMQAGLLFHTLLQPHSGVYLMQHRYWIEGSVDIDVFRETWQMIVDRHPILRTIFFWDTQTQPHQVVKRRMTLPFDYYDWQGLSDSEQEARLEELLATERREGFDLGSAAPLRIRLFRLGDRRYLLIRSHHHILLDAWCTSLILTELRDHYTSLIQHEFTVKNRGPAFSDYIAWLLQQDMAAAELFWRGYLQDFSEPTPLAIDRPVADDQKMIREVKDLRAFLSVEDTEALHVLARRSHLTLNTIVQAAWALLLSRYSGHCEVLFGITVAGRPAELSGIETMLGLFINSLPLRVRINPEQSLQEYLHNIQQQTLEIREFEYPSLTQIQEWSELPRGHDLFQHLLAFENAPVDPVLYREDGIWWFVNSRHRTHTNYPINGVVIPGPKLYLQISYQYERFDSAQIERMFEHWQHLLLDMIYHSDKRLGELAMLADAERRQILMDWNQTNHSYSEPCDIVALFEAQAALTPDDVAAAFQGHALTYFELNNRVNRVAHTLLSEGVGPETLIAIFNDRGIDYLVMMLGVFKAGSAYLPLDPSHPDGRIAQVLKESGVELILTGTSYFERVLALAGMVGDSLDTGGGVTHSTVSVEQTPTTRACASLSVQLLCQPDVLILEDLESCENEVENPPGCHTPDNLAFVIFTSGSTGMPKGAMVEYKGMFNNLITKVPTLGLTGRDVIAQTAGQCFDISVWQHLTALVCGARVEIFPDEIVKEPNQLLAQLAESGVTVLEAVPSMIQALLEIADETIELPKLRWLIACGEAFQPELCRRWMDRFPHVKVLNAYGPAECSDDVSYYEVPARPGETETHVPIGKPVHNTQLYLLDRWLEPVPIGVPGEICVAGIQVGRGYLNRPDLTAEKFIPDPFDFAQDRPFDNEGTRLYRTGDLGCYREDGAIEFLGRIDHQVKIRGVRIEPGEIEAQLLTYPKMEQALVVVRESGGNGKRLVAYVVHGEQVINNDAELFGQLREYLAARLPNAMMPSAFVRLDGMPLSANGKIDRKALPEPDMTGQSDRAYIAPRNLAEEVLVDIWKEVLGIERVGVADNFFELGGHSLLAVQVLSRIRRVFGVEVPLRRLFDASTIETLALVVEEFLIEHLNNLSEEEAEALLIDDEEGVSMDLKQ
jgi:amino acid adenylation domain-containing protein